MSLRSRLFLTLCGLLAASTLAQVLLVRSLATDLDREVDDLALFLGSRVAQVVTAQWGPCDEGETCEPSIATWIDGNHGSWHEGQGHSFHFGNEPGQDGTGRAWTASSSGAVTTVELVRVPDAPPSKARTVTQWAFGVDGNASPGTGSAKDGENEDRPELSTQATQIRRILSRIPESSRHEHVFVFPEPSSAAPDLESTNTRRATESAEVNGSDAARAKGFTLAYQTRDSDRAPEAGGRSAPDADTRVPVRLQRTESVIVRRTSVSQDPSQGPPSSGEAANSEAGEGEAVVEAESEEVIEQTIQLHLDAGSGGRYLMIEKPDLVGRVPIPQGGMQERLAHFQKRLLLGSASLLLFGLVVAAWIAQRMTAPLRALSTASSQIADGALGIRVPETSRDRDLSRTLGAFNHMSSRLAELEAHHRQIQASHHMGEIGDIARGLAHSLRNPLNALGLSVEELANRAAPAPSGQPAVSWPETDQGFAGQGLEDQRSGTALRLAESARRQIRRLDQGIRSFLLLASQSGGAVEEVDMADLVRDVGLEAIQDGSRPVHLDLEIADEVDGHRLDAVAPELRAVVQALVVNALEASPDAGRVRVRLERIGAEAGESPTGEARATGGDRPTTGVRMIVEDRGPGFAPEVRERLFTPHLSTKPNGSGMGLFLAHRIARHRYGGQVEIADREGGGSRVSIELGPRVRLGEPEAGTAPSAGQESTP